MVPLPIILVIALTTIGLNICANTGYEEPGAQEWNFIDVRNHTHMFYWLYYTTAKVNNYTERPLVIWLQGGPGESSTGYGNFDELGPLDVFGNERNWTWVKNMNVLFIDSPVGSGFSYVDNQRYYPSNNKQIALDLVEFMKRFYAKHSEFINVPLHIFGQDYGAKMASEFALELHYAQQRNEIQSNLSSVGLGNPIISPIECVRAWVPYLQKNNISATNGYKNSLADAEEVYKLIEKKSWFSALKKYRSARTKLIAETKKIDFYNIKRRTSSDHYLAEMLPSNNCEGKSKRSSKYDFCYDKLYDLMAYIVSVDLSIPKNIEFDKQRLDVYAALVSDIMKPVVHIVERLLEETDLKVGVYSGNWDLLCPTTATAKWIFEMEWSDRDEYVNAMPKEILVNGVLEGYEQSGGKLTMFSIERAGHMVPADNPAAMSYILRKLINFG